MVSQVTQGLPTGSGEMEVCSTGHSVMSWRRPGLNDGLYCLVDRKMSGDW